LIADGAPLTESDLRDARSTGELDLRGRNLSSLPEEIGQLTTIKTMRLNGNRLTRLPPEIGALVNLRQLDIDGNRLTQLPVEIGKLTKLETLWASGNELAWLPPEIGQLTSLRRLYVTHNRLSSLPREISSLAILDTMDVSHNHLTSLPPEIGALVYLETLRLSGNRLAALPPEIGQLGNLVELDLDSNQLTDLPWQLADRLTVGLQLKVGSNPLEGTLPEVVARGAVALATYLESLENAIRQYDSKLLLVGEGNVGKTSLVAALMGAPFVEGRNTTHGIEISLIKLRHPVHDLDMTLRAWDFGGQDIYRVTHQFFLTRHGLYIVVWNPREGQGQGQIVDWLRRIRLRTDRNARIILVATHCAERLPELDYQALEGAFPGILAGNAEVDNRTEAGISELRTSIAEQAAKLPRMGQLISPRWVAARDEILARAKTEPQIRYEQFARICTRNGVVDREILTLAQLMHDLGYIIHYSEDEGLKDIVVLNPEWLTKAISYVLEDKPTRDAGGRLDHKRLREIWQEREEGPAYPARYHPYFLRLMEKFDISYRLDGDEYRSLVAQLVPYKRPLLPWQLTASSAKTRKLALVCRLSEPAPGLVPWLTVRHHRASTGLYWRRGVFLRHPISAYSSEALLELRDETELYLEVRAPSPDLYFNSLRDSIEDLIIARWPGLTHKLFVPCPGWAAEYSACPGQFSLEALLRFRERGKITSVPCMECAESYEISLLLTGFSTQKGPLLAKLDGLQEQLGRVEDSVRRAEVHSAEIAQSVRRVLRIVSTEVTDCPRLFTLDREASGWRRNMRFDQYHYRITLWCEHPGYWHPWFPASYSLDPPKEWAAKIGPYAILVFKTLQLVIPLAGSAINVLLPPDQLIRARSCLQLMGTIVSELPDNLEQGQSDAGVGSADGQLSLAEGKALRGLRILLFKNDHLREFGGLRRVVTPSGDFAWVCPDHYAEYDPGLPHIPEIET
jgi:internalin A